MGGKSARKARRSSKGRQDKLTRASGETVTLPVEPWKLPAPTLEYAADACGFQVAGGAPHIYFYQFGVVRPVATSAIAITMSPERLRQTARSFDRVVERIPVHPDGWPNAEPEQAEGIENIAPERFRSFVAGFARGGCTNEFAMIDFYRAEFFSKETHPDAKAEEILRGEVRVFMTPLLLQELHRLISRGGDDDQT